MHWANWGTYIYWIHITVVVGVHGAIRKQTVGEQREEDKLRQSQKFVA